MRVLILFLLPVVLFAKANEHLQDPAVKNAFVGIYAFRVDDQKVLFNENEEKLFNPGSVQKILVGVSALKSLGKQHRFVTELFIKGRVEKGILKGDVIVKGGGDALLNDKQLAELASQLKRSGINKVQGSICYDTSFFSGLPIHPSWQIEDLGTKNAVESSALCYQKNTLWVRAKESAGKVHVQIENNFPIKVRNLAKVGTKNTLYIYRDQVSNTIIVAGFIQKNQSIAKSITVTNPGYICAIALKKKILASGIQVQGSIKASRVDGNCKKVSSVSSVNLSEYLQLMLSHSDNLIPEQLLRVIGKKERNVGSNYSGLQVVKDQLSKQGIGRDQYQIFDASGVSRKNLLSPKIIVQTIRNVMKTEHARDFLSYLSIGGQSGTCKNFIKGPLIGQVFAKTGSLNGIRNLAGLVVTKTGKTICFCIMVNHYICSPANVNAWINRVLMDLYLHY